jgi:CRISPR-associated protein Cas2
MAFDSVFLVAYDISNNKKRSRLFKTLKSYGVALQESLFYCDLRGNDKKQTQLTNELNTIKLDTDEAIHCFLIKPEQAMKFSPTPIQTMQWIV